MIKSLIKKYLSKIFSIKDLFEELEKNKFLMGQILVNNLLSNNSKNINDYEASIFSQWGEDGIIAFITHKLNLKNDCFVEFGVDNYVESNTRFLLFRENWDGLVIDSSKKNIKEIESSYYYWRYNILAKNYFINQNNINIIFEEYLKGRRLGLLSIDIDGNDYWVLKSLDLKKFKPKIIICEYNSLFGNKFSLTIPYSENFNRENFSNSDRIYYGASIKAFVDLLSKNEYSFLGSNKNANNLFFVSKEFESYFEIQTIHSAYKKNKFREFDNEDFDIAQRKLDKKKFFDLDHNKISVVNYLDLNA
jgi:hypothetical protein